MSINILTKAVAVSFVLTLGACSDSDDTDSDSSELNPDLDSTVIPGEPGGDTTAIAGLWNGSMMADGVEDVIYWNVAADGVLTRYDYQQDGTNGSSGQNCYVIGAPMTLTPEGGDSYSIADVAATFVRDGDNMTVTLVEEDKNDIDEDGDVTEMPTLDFALLTTPTLADLNDCTSEEASQNPDVNDGETVTTTSTSDDPALIDDQAGLELPVGQERPGITAEECGIEGGSIVGDIGDGAIHRSEYLCESGQPPIASILYPEDGPIPIEGAVCCV